MANEEKLAELARKYNDWCADNNLDAEDVEEMLAANAAEPFLTAQQEKWLRDFLEEWNRAENEGREQFWPQRKLDLIKRWDEKAARALVGRTITSAYYLSAKDCENLGWDETGVALILDNGAAVIVQADDEGNGPGALLVINKDASEIILPVIF